MLQLTMFLNIRLVNDGMIIQTSSPCEVLPPLKFVLVENGRKPLRSKVTDTKSHWSVMAVGSEGHS